MGCWLMRIKPERAGRDRIFGKNRVMARASTHIEKICRFRSSQMRIRPPLLPVSRRSVHINHARRHTILQSHPPADSRSMAWFSDSNNKPASPGWDLSAISNGSRQNSSANGQFACAKCRVAEIIARSPYCTRHRRMAKKTRDLELAAREGALYEGRRCDGVGFVQHKLLARLEARHGHGHSECKQQPENAKYPASTAEPVT